ncbi:LysR substrate binding domain-containing protein [Streptomyces indicus]|uniref:LysR substrate binding domain-containing protein n=1 Tax=Streptomyces indicus TaxID=417292 RepID=A0A1G9CCJ9_9ACTN|nr:LysR substrate binding domain-containing protein [Streptomyces indicus]
MLALVAQGRGMAVMPELSLRDAPPTVEIADLGPGRPTRTIGYVTTPELARTAAVRALIRELRAERVRTGPGRPEQGPTEQAEKVRQPGQREQTG